VALKYIQTLRSNQGFLKYFHNTLWMFTEQFLRIVAGLIVGIWVARYLGPTQFGVFNYVLAFTTIFGGIAKLGLDGIVVRELVTYPEKRNIYLGTAFWLKFSGGVLAICSLIAVTQFASNDTKINLFILVVSAGIIFQSFEIIEFYFRSQVLAKFISICKVSQLALSSLAKVCLMLTNSSLVGFMFVSLLDQFTLAVAFFVAYRYQIKSSFYKHFDWRIAKRLLKESYPFALSNILVMIYMRIDQIMIKEMLGEYDAGIYSAAVRLSEFWYFIPVIITNSLFPAIINAKNTSKELYYKRLQGLYALTVWLAIGIALPITFLNNWIVVLLYGDSYKEAGQVLMYYIWTGVFMSLGVIKVKWQISENLGKYHFIGASISMTSKIALNIWLIPKLGIVGAAIGTLISQFISAYLINFFFKELTPQLKLINCCLNLKYLFSLK
jgi:O-antigen/teichoic acid export membrane protein